ncbi:MAG TPA: GNAT family N-acetyltransferase [Pyrinomonadaceae bacterium]|jgi:ribosomal protein S18 acetylase RimI-like enzyme|nr:GNAT family N-acetyltransferase [Pyrinomonadaceae bacterium]
MSDIATLEFQNDEFVPRSKAVRVAEKMDIAAAIQVVRMSFATDPIARWVYPDITEYMTIFPDFINGMAGRSFEHGTAYISAGSAGAALWLPPGVSSNEEVLGDLVENTVSPAIRKDLNSFMEQMAAFHPTEPHWYLPMIAVDPYRFGQGIGTSLMRYALEKCDEQELPAYLESSNPRNITLYQRFGFEIVGLIRAGGSPPMFPMMRRPRTS